MVEQKTFRVLVCSPESVVLKLLYPCGEQMLLFKTTMLKAHLFEGLLQMAPDFNNAQCALFFFFHIFVIFVIVEGQQPLKSNTL